LERSDLCPEPTALDSSVSVITKVDGSTLIVSKYKGQLIVRTRGTSDATKLDNGHEIAPLLAKHPSIQQFFDMYETASCSLLWEWVSPLNRIVLSYPEPDLILIGAINHEDYSLWPQDELDALSVLMKVKRPTRHSFNTIEEMVKTVQALEGQEGVCVYYNDSQSVKKLKALRYLTLHRLKSELGSISKVLDLYIAHLENEPLRTKSFHPQSFYQYVASVFDFEIAQQVRPMIDQIEDAHWRVADLQVQLKSEIEAYRKLSRKDAALSIIARYGNSPEKGLAFILLDNRSVPTKTLRDLIERELEKTT